MLKSKKAGLERDWLFYFYNDQYAVVFFNIF